jgi:hypothetical protein
LIDFSEADEINPRFPWSLLIPLVKPLIENIIKRDAEIQLNSRNTDDLQMVLDSEIKQLDSMKKDYKADYAVLQDILDEQGTFADAVASGKS